MIKLIFGIRFPISGHESIEHEIIHTSLKLDDCEHLVETPRGAFKSAFNFCPECGRKLGVYKEERLIEYKLREGFSKNNGLYYEHHDNIFGTRIFQVKRMRDINFNEYDYLILHEGVGSMSITDLEVNLKLLNKLSIKGDEEGVFIVYDK